MRMLLLRLELKVCFSPRELLPIICREVLRIFLLPSVDTIYVVLAHQALALVCTGHIPLEALTVLLLAHA